MKCINLPILWRKFFLIIANNRDCVYNFCDNPHSRFDRHCREWYFDYNYNLNQEEVLFDGIE